MSETQNTEVSGGGEPIVSTGSSGSPVDFDELEQVMSTPRNKPAVDKPKPKADADKKPTKKASDDSDSDDDEVEDDPKKGDDADSDDTEDKTSDQKKASDDKSKPKPKVYKVKREDGEVEVRGDDVFEVKVNGKPEKVDLQTALNEYSGKTDWTRKYQTLDTERKGFESERAELQGAIDNLHDLAITQNKPTDAVAYLAEMLGGDGMKIVSDMKRQMFKAFEELSKLTPEQRELREAQEEAATLKSKAQQDQASRARKAEAETVAKRVEAIKTQHNITDERFQDIFKTLQNAKVPAAELTPELIGEVHQRWLQMDEVDVIVDQLKPEGDLAQVKLALLEEWKRDPTLTANQMRTICEQVFGGKKSPGSKLKAKIERSGGGQGKPRSTSSSKSDALTFDDL